MKILSMGVELFHVQWQTQTDRQKHRRRDRHTGGQTDTQMDRQTDRQTETQTERETHRRTDRHTDGQTDRQTDRYDEPNSRFSQFCKRAYKPHLGERSRGLFQVTSQYIFKSYELLKPSAYFTWPQV
jgi:hypothetical protein